MRAVELYCGIGGCAAALGECGEVAAAYDISQPALAVYGLNFPHPAHGRTLESLPVAELARHAADLWWMSPPCQPYTQRGLQRDLNDPRSDSFIALLSALREVRPQHIALENVPPFIESAARRRLLDVLDNAGYTWRELVLCPTERGIPARRRRYYLVATQHAAGLRHIQTSSQRPRRLADFLEVAPPTDLLIPNEIVQRYRSAMHVIAEDDDGAVAQCFTAAYGRSPVRSGSYLHTPRGPRYFSPREILRLLGFPDSFRLPDWPAERLWPLVGNSLSLDAVRYVLDHLPA